MPGPFPSAPPPAGTHVLKPKGPTRLATREQRVAAAGPRRMPWPCPPGPLCCFSYPKPALVSVSSALSKWTLKIKKKKKKNQLYDLSNCETPCELGILKGSIRLLRHSGGGQTNCWEQGRAVVGRTTALRCLHSFSGVEPLPASGLSDAPTNPSHFLEHFLCKTGNSATKEISYTWNMVI